LLNGLNRLTAEAVVVDGGSDDKTKGTARGFQPVGGPFPTPPRAEPVHDPPLADQAAVVDLAALAARP